MKKNPFKFGSIVDGIYFTDRQDEIEKVKSILKSDNHLIIISPRRFGKTSLIIKVLKATERPYVFLDLQLITNIEDFASQLLKRIYRIYPFEKLKQMIRSFRVIPDISINPINNEVEIKFRPSISGKIVLEDILNLMEKISRKKEKLVVVFDEFQETKSINNELDKHLRSIMQHHKNISYIFLGSQESLMRDIFEKKKSPFYHFGYLLPLNKIPRDEFKKFLTKGFKTIPGDPQKLSDEILDITKSHPYYTQQLAFNTWENINNDKVTNPVDLAVDEIIRHHDMDYERLWNTVNRTDKKILIGMSVTDKSPLSKEFTGNYFNGATSTIFSGLKRLMIRGLVIKVEQAYEIDDPFFMRWLKLRRTS